MANYYVPTKAREKSASLNKRYTLRMLCSRFALISTFYKWIDVAINVRTVSCSVEILLGDTRSNRIVLPYRTWRALLEKRADFERFVQSIKVPSLTIHDLSVQLMKLRDESIVKLSLLDACIYLKPTSMLFMFEQEHCVERVYYTLH
ncbi:uncharacterized protein LOC120358495 [Solenopsis invicta]|uniref:uncharacterized protein LOC120358495 n=1 Tax=Solenopsis invicta TaxID=13686 RepID=UPI00193E0D2B|nr:uncharacterized protein LOC120358495 [Solenopsis invicta]